MTFHWPFLLPLLPSSSLASIPSDPNLFAHPSLTLRACCSLFCFGLQSSLSEPIAVCGGRNYGLARFMGLGRPKSVLAWIDEPNGLWRVWLCCVATCPPLGPPLGSSKETCQCRDLLTQLLQPFKTKHHQAIV
ncbi:hypothetical protein BC834DRAFT_310301 [Gloeopeniophorella convolvens]|nr:hypothetical protein BC834DRAFT_310301 [Gloeopeniophorella convolvens]